ncbi:hypothetical protein T484DRAFT_1821309 [Baffinella frigidus]|nr:hypothetical protein T484DRAFT_1821309 [Cryptophyta sp. CCMP2293]
MSDASGMMTPHTPDTWTLSAMAIGKEAKAVSLTGAINSQSQAGPMMMVLGWTPASTPPHTASQMPMMAPGKGSVVEPEEAAPLLALGSVVEPEEAEPLLALVARIMLARCDKRLNPDAVPLRALALFLNGVGDAGATVLAGALRGNPSLTQISLKNNCIQDLGLTALGKALEENSLTALGKALEENSVLRILDLSLNNADDKGATALSAMLQKLSLISADDKGATALSAMLQVNCALRVLDLDRNTVREAGATALAEGLQKNSSLQVLGLSHNKVSDAGMRALENCFSSTNRTLVELRVQFNPAHAALLHRVLKSVSENVAVPSAIHFPVSPALYGETHALAL